MIYIILPAANVNEAVAIRDRIRGLILKTNTTDRAVVGDRGVVVSTEDPVRVVGDLASEGFF